MLGRLADLLTRLVEGRGGGAGGGGGGGDIGGEDEEGRGIAAVLLREEGALPVGPSRYNLPRVSTRHVIQRIHNPGFFI